MPIPGTTKPNRLDENIAAATVCLTPEQVRGIDDAVATIAVEGDRYSLAGAERTRC